MTPDGAEADGRSRAAQQHGRRGHSTRRPTWTTTTAASPAACSAASCRWSTTTAREIVQAPGLRRDPLRDDPRDARHPARRPPAVHGAIRQYLGDAARPLGGRHAGGRDDQLQRHRSASPATAACGRRATRCRWWSASRRTGDDTLQYRPRWTTPRRGRGPWTVTFPLERDDAYGFYEYACHEGNNAMRNILSGARAAERTAPR